MVEWSITTVLKTVVPRGTGGSNPFRHVVVGIAQLVSAPDCGSGGPGFESLYPPFAHWAIAKR